MYRERSWAGFFEENRANKGSKISIGFETMHPRLSTPKVILIGGGEPLAHPKTGDFISLMGENNINIGITTNGSFIDKFINPISEYSNWTRVSVDAATEETFSILRPTKGGKSKFPKIINNMRMLADTKKGTLGFSYLIQTEAGMEWQMPESHAIWT